MSDPLPSALAPHLTDLQQTILRLADRDIEERLADDLEYVTKLMRFDFYHYAGSFSIGDSACVRRELSNLPPEWRQRYPRTDSSELDPIAEAVRGRVTPLAWRERPINASDDENVYKTAHDCGIGNGIIAPIHSRNGDSAALGLFVRADRHDDEEAIGASLGDAGLTAMYLHDSMTRIVAKSHHAPRAPLTRREIECLHWIANHKSNWAIAKILGISEHGAVYYVRRIMWKLDAQNRYQAVARATAYGLI